MPDFCGFTILNLLPFVGEGSKLNTANSLFVGFCGQVILVAWPLFYLIPASLVSSISELPLTP